MNLMHLKYAVTIAETGGMNRAAEKLLIAQSNLSRAMKELEADLGIQIFDRSSKGMTLTEDGHEFIRYARSVLTQMNEMENIYKRRSDKSIRYSVSVPRAAYMCEAFHDFVGRVGNKPSRIYYKETNSMKTIESVLDCSSNIGFIHSEKRYEKYFYDYIAGKGISCEPIGEYRYMTVASKKSVLAKYDKVTYADLMPLVQISFADTYVPYISAEPIQENEGLSDIKRRIFVVESMSAYSTLNVNPESFMMLAPNSESILDRVNLIQRECTDCTDLHKDIMIWRSSYKFTELDRMFISAVKEQAAACGIKVRNSGRKNI